MCCGLTDRQLALATYSGIVSFVCGKELASNARSENSANNSGPIKALSWKHSRRSAVKGPLLKEHLRGETRQGRASLLVHIYIYVYVYVVYSGRFNCKNCMIIRSLHWQTDNVEGMNIPKLYTQKESILQHYLFTKRNIM